MPDQSPKFPSDRLELLLTTRKTFLMRLKSDLQRIEDEIAWCRRYLPTGQALEGDEEVADLLRQAIETKTRSIATLEALIAEQSPT